MKFCINIKIMETKGKIILAITVIILSALAFWGGWYYGHFTVPAGHGCKSEPMRQNGFKFVRPLLVCDTNSQKDLRDLAPLQKNLQDIITEETKNGDITDASVYFQDFNSDGRIDINPDEQFNAASIGKVAIMIAVLKMAQDDPGVLSQKIKNGGGDDANASQEIKPADWAKNGQIYTVGQLITLMIKNSDNNAFSLLESYASTAQLGIVFKDLQIPFQFDPKQPELYDFITTKEISYLFRVLYNATYLNNDLSDETLAILNSCDYKNGLVAGVPSGTAVAHKFGLKTYVNDSNQVVKRELHDCGIIYHDKNPYLLCVMTKSASPIPNIENTIKKISSAVYQFQDKR